MAIIDGPRAAAGRGDIAGSRGRLRPRDAGTLLVVEEGTAGPRLLLGRRAAGHVFMAGKYVFPGGRVERADRSLAAAFALPADAQVRLLAATGPRFGARGAVAVALAAIRETFEEAGAMIGRPVSATGARPLGSGPSWARFAEAGVVPDPALLVPVARAITPPGPPRRYDTRFFAVSAAAVLHQLPFIDRPDHEFDTLGWFALDALDRLDLPGITRQVLSDIAPRLKDGTWRDATRPMPFYRRHRAQLVRDMI